MEVTLAGPYRYHQYLLRDTQGIRIIHSILPDSISPCPDQKTMQTDLPQPIPGLKAKGGNLPEPSHINS